ncbi:hypothetical protein COP1_024713 [Malus domestica]
MAPVPNTRPNGDDEDPRPIKQPRLGEAEDSKEEKPKLKLDTDPMALDDQSPLVEYQAITRPEMDVISRTMMMSSNLNPNTLMFALLAYQTMENFFAEWWALVQSSPFQSQKMNAPKLS